MIYFLLLTAFTVSVDSLACGFSLSFGAKKKLPIIVGIALTVFVMCLITNYGALLLNSVITEKTASLGGLLLIGVGVYNLLKKKTNNVAPRDNFLQILTTGFAVGLDGALANLSLSLMGLNAIYVPVVIAVMHALMIALGIMLSQTHLVKKFAKIGFMPPLILILLGAYKLLGLFI